MGELGRRIAIWHCYVSLTDDWRASKPIGLRLHRGTRPTSQGTSESKFPAMAEISHGQSRFPHETQPSSSLHTRLKHHDPGTAAAGLGLWGFGITPVSTECASFCSNEVLLAFPICGERPGSCFNRRACPVVRNEVLPPAVSLRNFFGGGGVTALLETLGVSP